MSAAVALEPLQRLAQATAVEVARHGVTAVCALWNPDQGTFWRHSAERVECADDTSFHPTVTFRSTHVVLSYRESFRDRWDAANDAVLDAAIETVVATEHEGLSDESTLKYLPYTLALLVQAVAAIGRSKAPQAARAKARLARDVRELERNLRRASEPLHPFVRFHAIRALREALASSPQIRSKILAGLVEQMRADTHLLLARHHTGLATPSETVVLAFCAGTLVVTDDEQDRKLALAAVEASLAAQDSTGCWPLGRVVRSDPGRLEIATYEVAWCVTTIFDALLRAETCSVEDEIGTALADALVRAHEFVLRSRVDLGASGMGWASDHPYQQPRFESWTSAIVLEHACSLEELAATTGNALLLKDFDFQRPRRDRWPSFQTWESVCVGDADGNVSPICRYLEERVIDRIEAHPRRLPSGDRECASVLLFGPPGTAKTTLVKAVAERLDWPIVFLSPGSFISGGLEQIESRAQAIFKQLGQMTRVVVLFDECDELFRNRLSDVADAPEPTRNITAFVTASMLPKLQDLHDRGRVLSFICTNYVSRMDPAVLRGGRIDHRLGVPPPDQAGRRLILAGHDMGGWRYPDEALDALARSTDRFTFKELRRLPRSLDRAACRWASLREARDGIAEAVDKASASLTIDENQYRQYEKDFEHFDTGVGDYS